jgi:hypothetical protein
MNLAALREIRKRHSELGPTGKSLLRSKLLRDDGGKKAITGERAL